MKSFNIFHLAFIIFGCQTGIFFRLLDKSFKECSMFNVPCSMFHAKCLKPSVNNTQLQAIRLLEGQPIHALPRY